MKDCCCNIATMEQVHDDLADVLKKLVATTYFHYYKVFLSLWLLLLLLLLLMPLSSFLD